MAQPDREPVFTLRTIRRLASAVGVPVREKSFILAGKAGSFTKDDYDRVEVVINMGNFTKNVVDN